MGRSCLDRGSRDQTAGRQNAEEYGEMRAPSTNTDTVSMNPNPEPCHYSRSGKTQSEIPKSYKSPSSRNKVPSWPRNARFLIISAPPPSGSGRTRCETKVWEMGDRNESLCSLSSVRCVVVGMALLVLLQIRGRRVLPPLYSNHPLNAQYRNNYVKKAKGSQSKAT